MVIITPLLCSLGLWQLDRAEQKRSQASTLEIRRNQPPVSLNDKELPEPDRLLYRNVLAQGRFLVDKTIFIANRKHLGRIGVHVVTPLQLSGNGRIVLVNRGWIENSQITETSLSTTNQDAITLQGDITIPKAPAIELTPSATQTQSPPRWPYLTLPHYTEWSGLEILPLLILQTTEDEQAFIRQWPAPKVSELMHIGYAIQWFAFAVIGLMVWLRLSLHKTGVTI